MSAFIYVCLCFTFLARLAVSLESETNLDCTENGECFQKKVPETNAIETKCNCNNDINNSHPLMYYNDLTDEFGNKVGNVSIVNIKHLLQTLTEKHNSQDKIQKEVEAVFKGVIVAVILFGVCVCLCVITSCIYCCRINIIDNRLKNDVEALAEKLNRECRFKKSVKKSHLEPVSESCNIIVEDAGVYVV